MSAELQSAPAPRQFVAVVFRPGDARAYTYHNDGEPVGIGDRVKIHGRSGDEQIVSVVALPDLEPPFPTKPILGLVPPEGPTSPPPLPF